jgi:hypothetical protein
MGLHTSSQFRSPDGYRFRSLEQSGAELKGRNKQKNPQNGAPVSVEWRGANGRRLRLCLDRFPAGAWPSRCLPLQGSFMSELLAGN